MSKWFQCTHLKHQTSLSSPNLLWFWRIDKRTPFHQLFWNKMKQKCPLKTKFIADLRLSSLISDYFNNRVCWNVFYWLGRLFLFVLFATCWTRKLMRGSERKTILLHVGLSLISQTSTHSSHSSLLCCHCLGAFERDVGCSHQLVTIYPIAERHTVTVSPSFLNMTPSLP